MELLTILAPSVALIINGAVCGWFALQQAKQKHKREEEQEESRYQWAMFRRSAELSKCMALDRLYPDSHICDIQDAMVKLDEACAEYDAFLERLRLEHLH